MSMANDLTLEQVVENLRAVLCDPEGTVCIAGSDGDRKIIAEALEFLKKRERENADLLEKLSGEVESNVALRIENADLRRELAEAQDIARSISPMGSSPLLLGSALILSSGGMGNGC